MAIPVTIGPKSFSKLKDARLYLSEILHSRAFRSEITNPTHIGVLEALFYSRPSKVDELNGRKIIGWCRSIQWTPCFAAMLDDGPLLNFSFHKSIDVLKNQIGDHHEAEV